MKTDKSKITLLTWHDHFFGQTRKPWTGMNTERMKQVLTGHGFTVEEAGFHEIVNDPGRITDGIVFYTFHQKPNRRQYITDLIHHLNDGRCLLVPSYDLLRCHENKGFQELYKKKIGLDSLRAVYLSSYKDVADYSFDYPVVLKSVDQSNAKGVHLVHDEKELIRKIRHLDRTGTGTKIDLFRRRYFRGKKVYPGYPEYSNKTDYITYSDYIQKERNFIVQEYLPGMTHDNRVLVMFDRYFVMQRLTRKGDFRASGTKKFDFDFETNPALLDYARELYGKFDAPFMSLDIAEHAGKYHLLEFQALHFGISAVKKNRGHYEYEAGSWRFVPGQYEIETVMMEALAKYLRNRME
ncbi:hypothetical protein JW948_00320 [bacterium]|nr:hypothetical protein [bacterium]